MRLLLLLLAIPAGLWAGEPKIEGPDTFVPYKIVKLKATGVPEKAGVVWKVRPVDRKVVVDFAGKVNTPDLGFVGPPGLYRVELNIAVLDKSGNTSLDFVERMIKIGTGPNPPPDVDPDVDPVPDPDVDPTPDPTPKTVTSFRVILVYESGQTLPASQVGILYGAKLEAAMNGATSGGGDQFGWRRLDKNDDHSGLPAGMKDVWSTVKPKITTTPSMVIQVNDKIIIEPLPATPEEAAALIVKHRGK